MTHGRRSLASVALRVVGGAVAGAACFVIALALSSALFWIASLKAGLAGSAVGCCMTACAQTVAGILAGAVAAAPATLLRKVDLRLSAWWLAGVAIGPVFPGPLAVFLIEGGPPLQAMRWLPEHLGVATFVLMSPLTAISFAFHTPAPFALAIVVCGAGGLAYIAVCDARRRDRSAARARTRPPRDADRTGSA